MQFDDHFSHSPAQQLASAQSDADYPPIYRKLMAVALLGVAYNAEAYTDAACKAVEKTLADPRKFRVCRAMAAVDAGRHDRSVDAMKEHLERHPDDDCAKFALAYAMKRAGQAGWVRVIEGVLATSADACMREAANVLLSDRGA